jgi:hypothetical protein
MTESNQQIIDRLKQMRDSRRKAQPPVAPAPPVDDGIDARLDRNGGVISVTNIENLPSIVEVMNVVEQIGASGRTAVLTFLGQPYHHGTGGNPLNTADEVQADVKIEITAPIAFNDALMIRWHEDPMPEQTADLIQRLLTTCKN